MTVFLVCYDISDNRERDRVARLLCRHGHRVQESVFELYRMDPVRHQQLREALRSIVSDAQTIRFYRIGQTGAADSSDLAGTPIARLSRTCLI